MLPPALEEPVGEVDMVGDVEALDIRGDTALQVLPAVEPMAPIGRGEGDADE